MRMKLVNFVGVLVLSASAAHAEPFVYVSNSDADTVSVIDAATNTVVTTITVGDEPRNLAVSPDGTRVLCAQPLRRHRHRHQRRDQHGRDDDQLQRL